MAECKIDPGDNFPYREETFQLIGRLRGLITKYSKKFGVPPLAIAGSIADEFNTRRGSRFALDWVQDYVVIGNLPSVLIQQNYMASYQSKLLNATRNDLGPGNINLKTASEIYTQYRKSFPRRFNEWSQLVDYLLTDEGTVVVAALVIKKAMQELAPLLSGRDHDLIVAILVTYYKQGPSYHNRFKARLGSDPTAKLSPGEGCRVYHQRAELQKALESN
jgi:hypothetical protein